MQEIIPTPWLAALTSWASMSDLEPFTLSRSGTSSSVVSVQVLEDTLAYNFVQTFKLFNYLEYKKDLLTSFLTICLRTSEMTKEQMSVWSIIGRTVSRLTESVGRFITSISTKSSCTIFFLMFLWTIKVSCTFWTFVWDRIRFRLNLCRGIVNVSSKISTEVSWLLRSLWTTFLFLFTNFEFSVLRLSSITK